MSGFRCIGGVPILVKMVRIFDGRISMRTKQAESLLGMGVPFFGAAHPFVPPVVPCHTVMLTRLLSIYRPAMFAKLGRING